MSANPNDSDLLAGRLATASAGIAFVLFAVGGLFLNYGIVIGFSIGAILLFIAAHQFHALARLKLQWPALLSEGIQRTYWDVFKISTYVSSAFAIAFSLIFAGGFYIFDLREQLSEATKFSPYRWPLLKPEEMVALRAKFREISPRAVSISCAEDDCGDLARNFRDIFGDLHWKVMCCTSPFSGFDPGIHLWGETSELKGLATGIEQATNGRLKIDMAERETWDTQKYPLQITIGAKP